MTIRWQESTVSEYGTHHVLGRDPLYLARFDEVLSFHPPGLASVRDLSGAYHIRPDGSPAYGPRFHRTFGFYEGRAAVEDDSGAHHVDEHGVDVGPRRFAWTGNFQGGRCAVRDASGRYFHVGPDDEPTYDERWRYAGDYREGAAVVQDDAGLHHHIDREGRRVGVGDFIDLDVFHKGFARARDAVGWFHLSRAGRPAYQRRFATVEPFYNGQARCEAFDGSIIVIDEAGRDLVRLRGPQRSPFAALSGDMVGFWRTGTLAAAVELGVPEALPGTVPELSARLGLPEPSARRLLRALGELGVVERVGDKWALTAKGIFLQGGHELSLGNAAREYSGIMLDRWKHLSEALRQGAFWSPPDFFAEAATDPNLRVLHHRTLAAYARHDYGPVAEAIDVDRHATIIDAGGGHGVLVRKLLERSPRLNAILLDRAEVLEHADVRSETSARLRKVAADFFAPWPVEGDAVVLTRILHDWSDETALLVLRHARRALRPGGRLYIAEMVLEDEAYSGGLCDLHLLAVTGGQERTRREYEKLVTEAGFVLREVRRLPSIVSLLVAEAS